MKKRDVLNSPRLNELKKRRRRDLQIKILLIVVSLASLFSLLVYVSRIEKLNIREVKISGNKVIETETINELVNNNLKGYYLYFIPKSNFLLYPKNKIKNELLEKFKRISSISFDLSQAKTLALGIVEREGKYVWCGENLPDINTKPEDHECSFVDSTGYIFDSAPYFSGDVYFKFFGTLSGSYFTPEFFQKFVAFKESLVDMSVRPSALLVKEDGDVDFYLSGFKLLPELGVIRLKKDFDLEKTVANLQASIITDPLKSDFKNKYSSMQYIDLRFGNKVYFKFGP